MGDTVRNMKKGMSHLILRDKRYHHRASPKLRDMQPLDQGGLASLHKETS